MNALLFLALLAPAADPSESVWAVCRLTSHGGSGTVIETGPGRTLILSCGHCFKGADRAKKITLDCPGPAGTSGGKVRIQLLKVDHESDLSLILLESGPLPYVAPVAGPWDRPTKCWSVGYDAPGRSAVWKNATVYRTTGDTTWTREPPWHGRSGGALLDAGSGKLVGVVSGYVSYPQGPGVYVSLDAIRSFLSGVGGRPAPPLEGLPPVERGLFPPPPPGAFPQAAPFRPYGDCPGGVCPLPGGR